MQAWYAARVRMRSEARVAKLLEQKATETFLPSWREQRVYSDRIRETAVAAFPGYLFCRIDLDGRLQVLNTPGVQGLVGAPAPEIIEDRLIQDLRRAFATPAIAAPIPYLAQGDQVRVFRGPMAGSEGILLRLKGSHRLVISLHLLQRSVAVEVDAASVVPVGHRGQVLPAPALVSAPQLV